MQRALIAVMVWMAFAPVPLAQAQDADGNYNIMAPEPKLGHKRQPQPEPWLLPKYQSPRGTKQHITRSHPRPYVPPRAPAVPPPIFVPQTGRLLPNLPLLPGAGPGGAETSQDRAVRCAHQAGLYGQAAGDRNTYIGSCINQ
jgi:hypothetical protein